MHSSLKTSSHFFPSVTICPVWFDYIFHAACKYHAVYGRPEIPHVVSNKVCVCVWSILCFNHPPEVRHFALFQPTAGCFLQQWLRGCFPAVKRTVRDFSLADIVYILCPLDNETPTVIIVSGNAEKKAKLSVNYLHYFYKAKWKQNKQTYLVTQFMFAPLHYNEWFSVNVLNVLCRCVEPLCDWRGLIVALVWLKVGCLRQAHPQKGHIV